jgi:hypothetical protein
VANGHANVALLNIEPLGTIICGANNQDRSAIFRYFPHQILTQVVQYLARLRYVSSRDCLPPCISVSTHSSSRMPPPDGACYVGSGDCQAPRSKDLHSKFIPHAPSRWGMLWLFRRLPSASLKGSANKAHPSWPLPPGSNLRGKRSAPLRRANHRSGVASLP